eukprot:TRINITY_DN752_c0_g1_i4.p1 TRINITY_DN752_c0_g1~~TRINITY_DN752_c0_g1_i4.p1  ORF type:complete len:314 (-),score=16.32 TRINITY_DN752_c0_g1_i4:397-1338(-)
MVHRSLPSLLSARNVQCICPASKRYTAVEALEDAPIFMSIDKTKLMAKTITPQWIPPAESNRMIDPAATLAEEYSVVTDTRDIELKSLTIREQRSFHDWDYAPVSLDTKASGVSRIMDHARRRRCGVFGLPDVPRALVRALSSVNCQRDAHLECLERARNEANEANEASSETFSGETTDCATDSTIDMSLSSISESTRRTGSLASMSDITRCPSPSEQQSDDSRRLTRSSSTSKITSSFSGLPTSTNAYKTQGKRTPTSGSSGNASPTTNSLSDLDAPLQGFGERPRRKLGKDTAYESSPCLRASQDGINASQ